MEDVSEKRTFQICRNLQDAGCKRTFVTEFLELEQSHSRQEQYRLLAKQKAALGEIIRDDPEARGQIVVGAPQEFCHNHTDNKEETQHA